ncbi:MAG: hypothetical protein BJ554DRAFT_6612 [Olpidium bornovanus]|uniref:Secreted protein n=1 Tax=Olpidium bornovanus TaxID=278681 RepID=A0A8H8DKK4_9FUNG|nr:MAG: hypothetical protein BJ554DRAFT_6612 [Olpidium bornovanus]
MWLPACTSKRTRLALVFICRLANVGAGDVPINLCHCAPAKVPQAAMPEVVVCCFHNARMCEAKRRVMGAEG